MGTTKTTRRDKGQRNKKIADREGIDAVIRAYLIIAARLSVTLAMVAGIVGIIIFLSIGGPT